MTFIQPNKNSSFMNIILGILAVGLVAGIFGMVALYNVTVNASHNISAAKAQLDVVGAQSTELNNTIVAVLGGDGLTKFAGDHGLVTESKPQYFTITQTSQKWPIASHY